MESNPGTLPDQLRLLAENERAIGSLYEEYARHLPEHEDFWLGLAAEERQHAEWIEQLGASESATSGLKPRFTIEAIRTFAAYIREQHGYAKQGTTMAASVATAYGIETALMERRFFEQRPQMSPDEAAVIARIRRETEQHVVKTKDALTTFVNTSAADTP